MGVERGDGNAFAGQGEGLMSEDSLDRELSSMQRWAYYGIEDDYLANLLEKEETIMADELSLSEAQQLTSLEAIIETGLQTFVDVGQALLEIRNRRLYRGQYGNFEEYCRERWGFRRAHAYRMIEAAQVVANLSPIGDTLPANEAQARPLTGLPAEWQREAWQKAVETANGKITADHIRMVVQTLHLSPDAGHAAVPAMSQPFDLITSHKSKEWYTPPEYIEMARAVMGGIDLDPASSALPQQWIQATTFYTREQDGLSLPWEGDRIWLNPPYGKDGNESNADIWGTRLIEVYRAGDSRKQAILLVGAKPGYNWFEAIWDQFPACFVRDRIPFIRPDGSCDPDDRAKVASVFFYLGLNLARFAEVFGRIGRVVNSEGNLL